MTFRDLQLSEPLLRAVEEKGYITPTPIQQQAIPPVLAGRDLQGCAQTGTGKTAAFTLPMLQLLAAERTNTKRREIRALVLTPTRELAIQIDECCRDYARYIDIRHSVIFGGVNQNPQVQELKRGVDLLVATPGRLLDLIGQGYVSLDSIRFFVLDEADRMLDMGFIHDIRRILPLLPKRRQTLFFSATMPDSIAKLAASMLDNPAHVTVTPPASVVDTIGQSVYFVEKSDKVGLLVDLLKSADDSAVLVFSRTKHGADRIARTLMKSGIVSAAIHGNKSQNARVKAMTDFKSGACRVLIATDIAARGIDISELPLVINYDLPEVPETYVHRIGRTGRAGCEGRAISFCSEEELPLLKDIQKLTGLNIPVASRPGDGRVRNQMPEVKDTAAAPRRTEGSRSASGPRASDSRSASALRAASGHRASDSSRRASDSRPASGPRASDSRSASALRAASGHRASDSRPASGPRDASDSRRGSDLHASSDSRRSSGARPAADSRSGSPRAARPQSQQRSGEGRSTSAPRSASGNSRGRRGGPGSH